MKVSVLIPLFNEENTIIKILEKINLEQNKQKELSFEIIVINDGSVDNSKKLLENNTHLYDHLISYDKNQGRGFALREGIKKISGEICLIQDADLEYLPEDNYNKLLKPFQNNKADVVYGSRFKGEGSMRVLFFWHMVANKLITLFSNFFSNLNFTDVETGYKLFRTDILKKIELKENSFSFEIEVTQKIAKIKPKIMIFEVGVSYFGRTYSEGKKITFKDALTAFVCIVRYGLFK